MASSASRNSLFFVSEKKPSLAPRLILVFYLFIQFIFVSLAHAEIRVGMTTPLTGPLQELGNNALAGINAYFNQVNLNGGIHGQKIHLFVEDDKYEPRLAAPNMRKLIEEQNVIAIIGNVGTPTAVVTVPIAIENNIPFIGAITGAPLLRQSPPNRYIFNYRASYFQEAASMIDGLIKIGIRPEEIAFFTQRDSYGDAGYEGAISALIKHGASNIYSLAHGRYRRNSLNVEGALATILDAPVKPRAIIMAGSYAPSAKFIKLAKQDLPNCLYLNMSFVGSTSLLKELNGETDNVIITQVVPSFHSDIPIAREYKRDLEKYNKNLKPSFISFESYIVAKIFVASLLNINSKIYNPESVINSLNKLSRLDLGLNLDISYSSDNHQAVNKIWPVMILNDQFIPVDWSEIANNMNITRHNNIFQIYTNDLR